MAATVWSDPEALNAFLHRLVQARVDAGLTQRQVATKLGVTNVTISRYETGARVVSQFRLRQFAKIYGVSLDWLILGKGSLTDAEVAQWGELLKSYSPETIRRTIGLLESMERMQAENG